MGSMIASSSRWTMVMSRRAPRRICGSCWKTKKSSRSLTTADAAREFSVPTQTIMPTEMNIPDRRILVIDDNHAIHDDFRKIFGATGGNEIMDAFEAELFGEAPGTLKRDA